MGNTLVTKGLSGSAGGLITYGLGITDVSYRLGTFYDYGLPYLNYVRLSLLASACTSVDEYERGYVAVKLGRSAEVFNICNGLVAGLYDSYNTPNASSAKAADTGMSKVYAYAPLALSELTQLGLASPVTTAIENYVNSSSPVDRLSGISTMIVLGTILQRTEVI